MGPRTKFGAAIICGLLALALVGCGDDDDASVPPQTPDVPEFPDTPPSDIPPPPPPPPPPGSDVCAPGLSRADVSPASAGVLAQVCLSADNTRATVTNTAIGQVLVVSANPAPRLSVNFGNKTLSEALAEEAISQTPPSSGTALLPGRTLSMFGAAGPLTVSFQVDERLTLLASTGSSVGSFIESRLPSAAPGSPLTERVAVCAEQLYNTARPDQRTDDLVLGIIEAFQCRNVINEVLAQTGTTASESEIAASRNQITAAFKRLVNNRALTEFAELVVQIR